MNALLMAPRRAAAGATVIFAVLAMLSLPSSPTRADTTLVDDCWGRGNQVETTFQIRAAADLWQVFPAMGKAPIIARDSRPADVVVFRDPFLITLPNVPAEDGGPRTYSGVVCVRNADGEVRLFADVPRDGFTPPSR
jgi:hypothetical protein